jgi:hypothetical protein
METSLPTRRSWQSEAVGRFSALAVKGTVFCFLIGISAFAQQRAPIFRAPKQTAPQQRPPNNYQPPPNQAPRNPNLNSGAGPRNNPHLNEWMNRHRDLPLEQQQRALESEPGFRELPAQTQQRMREQLSQLNSMRPEERSRFLERNEAMERLSVPQRQQVRSVAVQLASLPEDRRRAVRKAYRDLHAMPDAQRQQYMNSPAYRGQFNDQERGTINSLISVEPLLSRFQSDGPQQ